MPRYRLKNLVFYLFFHAFFQFFSSETWFILMQTHVRIHEQHTVITQVKSCKIALQSHIIWPELLGYSCLENMQS